MTSFSLFFFIFFFYYRICSDTEEIGTSTLLQMGRQREQLETTAGHIRATQSTAEQASIILRSMYVHCMFYFLFCKLNLC